MPRIFPSVCPFLRIASPRAGGLRILLAFPFFFALAQCGCEEEDYCLAPAIATEQMAALQASPPTISRSQKPENDAPPRPAKGSVLDLAAYSETLPNDSEVKARIRATVNGVAILDDEVREGIYPLLMATQSLPEPERSTRRKEAFDKQLQQLIEREVILQDAFARLKERPQVMEKLKEAAGKDFDKKMREQRKRLGIKTDEEFKAYLRSQGLSVSGVRRQIEHNFMAMEYMRNLLIPKIDRIGHEQIAEYYQNHPEEFQVPDSFDWQDIFIDASKFPNRDAARQFANQLVAKARAGEDFKQLVMKHDQGDSCYRNGDGYGHLRGEIKPLEAEPILLQLHDGEIGPIIELTNGFHVIRLVKRQYAGLRPFDEKTQTSIRNKLQNDAWEKEYKRTLESLKRKAAIEVSRLP